MATPDHRGRRVTKATRVTPGLQVLREWKDRRVKVE
jgi:hypothetical protein